MIPSGNCQPLSLQAMGSKESSHLGISVPGKFWFGRVEVVENRGVAQDTFLLVVEAAEVAHRILPGQFVMLRFPETFDPLLGRAFALYDVCGAPAGQKAGLAIVYQVVGKMTRQMKDLGPGAELELWGPLGNGFPVFQANHLVLVAGGIGVTPFMALAKEVLGISCFGSPPRDVPKVERLTLCYGVRTRSYLTALEEFRRLGVEVCVATEDGSEGHRGLVTELLTKLFREKGLLRSNAPAARAGTEQRPDLPSAGIGTEELASLVVVACGPEPMLEATAHICRQFGVPCWVSLETPMACGVGICFSCAVRIRLEDGSWDYRRACVEGPIFPADAIAWEP